MILLDTDKASCAGTVQDLLLVADLLMCSRYARPTASPGHTKDTQLQPRYNIQQKLHGLRPISWSLVIQTKHKVLQLLLHFLVPVTYKRFPDQTQFPHFSKPEEPQLSFPDKTDQTKAGVACMVHSTASGSNTRMTGRGAPVHFMQSTQTMEKAGNQ